MATNEKCTCTSAARRDAWHLGGIDRTSLGVIYGTVSCTGCGAIWRTRAKYIRSINGATPYLEAFMAEDTVVMRNLQVGIHALDDQISELRKKRNRLQARYDKIQKQKR